MRRLTPALLPLLLAACSAEITVDTDPMSVTVPVTSVLQPVYAEVAVDLPKETQGLDVTVNSLTADLTVYNPSATFTLNTSARLSFTGTATPTEPVTYTNANLPAYYATATVLLASQDFKPKTTTPVTIPQSAGLEKVIGKQRIWIIVSNTVSNGGIGAVLPLEIQLNNIVLHADVTKNFGGLEGALSVGGL